MFPFKEIILHVGIDKTGSTSIQLALYNERHKLVENQKLHIIDQDYANQSLLMFGWFEDFSIPNIIRPPRKNAKAQLLKRLAPSFEKFEKEIKASKAERLMISGEMISLMTEQGISNLKKKLDAYLEHDNYRIIFVVRHPISWTTSKIQQMVKSGFTLKGQYSSLPKQYIHERYKRWAKVFSEDAIQIISFEQAIKKGGIVPTFLAHCEIDSSFYNADKTTRKNTSLSQEAVEKISLFNKEYITQHRKAPSKKIIASQNFAQIEGDKFAIPKAMQNLAWELAKEDLKWLSEKKGIHYDLDT